MPLRKPLRSPRAHLRCETLEAREAPAANLLGISRKNLWEKLRAHHIVGYERDDVSRTHSTG